MIHCSGRFFCGLTFASQASVFCEYNCTEKTTVDHFAPTQPFVQGSVSRLELELAYTQSDIFSINLFSAWFCKRQPPATEEHPTYVSFPILSRVPHPCSAVPATKHDHRSMSLQCSHADEVQLLQVARHLCPQPPLDDPLPVTARIRSSVKPPIPARALVREPPMISEDSKQHRGAIGCMRPTSPYQGTHCPTPAPWSHWWSARNPVMLPCSARQFPQQAACWPISPSNRSFPSSSTWQSKWMALCSRIAILHALKLQLPAILCILSLWIKLRNRLCSGILHLIASCNCFLRNMYYLQSMRFHWHYACMQLHCINNQGFHPWHNAKHISLNNYFTVQPEWELSPLQMAKINVPPWIESSQFEFAVESVRNLPDFIHLQEP